MSLGFLVVALHSLKSYDKKMYPKNILNFVLASSVHLTLRTQSVGCLQGGKGRCCAATDVFMSPHKKSLVVTADIFYLPSAIQLQKEERPLCGELWPDDKIEKLRW